MGAVPSHFLKPLLKLSFLIAIVLICGNAPAQKSAESFVRDEVLVKYKPNAKSSSIDHVNSILGTYSVERLGDLGWRRLKISSGASVEKVVEELRKSESVLEAQPNFYYRLQATPNDPQFTAPGMYGLTKISAPQAWDIATGSSTVVVANIDTGIRYTHEDLAANMWVNSGEIAANGIDDDGNGFIDDVHGYDFRFNDADPIDQHGHGTHTAGTIGAVGNNSLGVVGVNWNVRLMAIKIYSASGTDTTSAMLINAYNYVRLMKNRGVNIRVTNNSYGGCNEACGYDQATKDAIDALGDDGILNVFAAGNSGTNNDVSPFYPASYTSPSVLSVAASDSADGRAFNYGINSVDLAAPGIVILSTGGSSNSHYTNMSGTSMATPHVAGAAALLSSLNPSLSSASLKATLMNSVDQLPQWNGFVKTGGRLNVFNALQNQTVCSFALNAPSSMLVPTKGGLYTFDATAAANCDRSVKSNVNWIVINGPNVLSGNGQVKFWVRTNATVRRTGTVTVGGQTITVVQSRDGIL